MRAYLYIYINSIVIVVGHVEAVENFLKEVTLKLFHLWISCG